MNKEREETTMTVYQYVFYDRETDEFYHFESTDLDEVNKWAYNEWLSLVDYYKDEDFTIDSMPFDNWDEFVEHTHHYICLAEIGGMEGERFTLQIDTD
jgi:hypothetical protein